MYSPAEAFLLDFHSARPGVTSEAFGELPVVFRGKPASSSYALLAATVPCKGERVAVLDLACGNGHLLSLLAARGQQGLELTGIDMSSAELSAAPPALRSKARLMQARAQHLPLDSGGLDVVLCHLALMLMDDVDKVLTEIARVLKPGGTLAAVVGGPSPPSTAFTSYVRILAHHRETGGHPALRFGDPSFRTSNGIQELFARRYTGVIVEEIAIRGRMAPRAICAWFDRMYDLHQLGAAARVRVEGEYLEAVQSDVEPDGMLEFPRILRYIEARAA